MNRQIPDEEKEQRAILAISRIVDTCKCGDMSISLLDIDPQYFNLIQPQMIGFFLDTILQSDYPLIGLELFYKIGLFDVWIPEISAMIQFTHENIRHKDIWDHTKQVVLQSPNNQVLRWASLFHDIGKIKTRKMMPNGEVHFFGHAEVGAKMFKKIALRLNLPQELTKKVYELILYHLRINQYESRWSDSAVRRLINEIGDCFYDLIELSRADITTKRETKKLKEIDLIEELYGRVEEIKKLDGLPKALPKGLGNEIIKCFDVLPGKFIGIVKKKLEEAIDFGVLERGRDHQYYIDWLKNNNEVKELVKRLNLIKD